MAGQIHALVVGIQRYDQVDPLQGPERDMRYVFGVLQAKFAIPRNHIIPLLDSSATYLGIVEGFEQLIEKVGPGDTAFFYFSGHGARAKSAIEFQHLSGDGFDETLVCVDSRTHGVPDLADKELAWFASRITAKGADTVFFLDCCHSGGLTRGPGMPGAVKRVDPNTIPRALEAYQGDWTAGEPNDLPQRRLLSIGACNRFQLAREYGRADKGPDKMNRGVLTLALEEALDQSTAYSYPDLFVLIRAATMAYNTSQTPQMDHLGGFVPHRQFLTGEAVPFAPAYRVSYQQATENGAPAGWWLNIGAAAGLVPGKLGQVNLLDAEGKVLQQALVSRIGLEKSFLQPSRPDQLDPTRSYLAAIQGVPTDPLLLGIEGSSSAVDALLQHWQANPFPLVKLGKTFQHPHYKIVAEADQWQLIHRISKAILFTAGYPDLYDRLRRVFNWERLAHLQSPDGASRGTLDFKIQRDQSAEKHLPHTQTEVVTPPLPGKAYQRFRIFLRNRSESPLHWYLFYLGDGFAITPRGQDLLPAQSSWSMAHHITLGLQNGAFASSDRLKLLCSEHPIDAFDLVQAPVPPELSRESTGFGSIDLKAWNAVDFNLNTVQELASIGNGRVEVLDGNLEIKFPPALTGSVHLWSAAPLHIGPASDPVPTDFLREYGIDALAFLSGESQHYQLIGLCLDSVPAFDNTPITLSWTAPEAKGRRFWPLAWDGEALFIAGRPSGDGKVLLTQLSGQSPSWRAGGGRDFKICLFEISDQTLNLEGMAGTNLADTLHQLYQA